MPTETGIFTAEEAKSGHLFSYRLAQYIGKTLPKKQPVYDFGCGPGAYLKYLSDIGFQHLTGIEGTKDIETEVSESLIVRRDLTNVLDLYLPQGNVICVEVFEHIPKEFEQIFIDNITSQVIKNGLLIMSAAHEGQAGYGHCNCRPDWYVIEQIEKRGFEHKPEMSTEARSVIEGPYAYLKENLFVFKKL